MTNTNQTKKSYLTITKDGQYLTANGKFTSNENLAYTYQSQEQAEQIAKQIGGKVTVLKVKSYLK